MITDVLAGVCLLAGIAFFVAGMVGVMRFPDALCRLHAVTKADNLGLGLVILGLILGGGSPFVMATLVLVWLLVLTGSAATCFLVAQCIMADERSSYGHPRADDIPARTSFPGPGRGPHDLPDPVHHRRDDLGRGHDDGGTG